MPGKKFTTNKHGGGARGGKKARGKNPTPATGGGRSRRERRQAAAEAKKQKALAEMVRAGEKTQRLSASLNGPAQEVDLPPWVDAEVAASESRALPGRLPLTLFRIKDRPMKDALVVMRLSEFQRHFTINLRETAGPADGEGG